MRANAKRSVYGNGFVSGVLPPRSAPHCCWAGLCAANRPAGTREALPGSIIIPAERCNNLQHGRNNVVE
jgi:hypothetical protein